MARQQDISLFSGDDRDIVATIIDGRTGQPLNLTTVMDIVWAIGSSPDIDGYCRYLGQVYRRDYHCRDGHRVPTAPSVRFEKRYTDGDIEITDAANGVATVSLDRNDLEPLGGDYYYEMCVITADDKKTTVLYGKVSIKVNMITEE